MTGEEAQKELKKIIINERPSSPHFSLSPPDLLCIKLSITLYLLQSQSNLY